MERLTQLIGKLNEQFEQNADYKQLLVTTQLIESELMQLSAASRQVQSTSKVAVMMPASRQVRNTIVVEKPVAEKPAEMAKEPVRVVQETVQEPALEEEQPQRTVKNGNGVHNNGAYTNGTATNGTANTNGAYSHETVGNNGYTNGTPRVNSYETNGNTNGNSYGTQEVNGNKVAASAAVQQQEFQYNPLTEIPTLAHQSTARELNEMMAAAHTSLNDKLKEDRVEVGHRLNDSPVRDLKKAIGINDRFVFISELFRGDEVMYERSIKTINGFRIYPEAQYWIERELKVKLGWDETKSATQHFYQLVKRRFS
jgi:hypothetical protein